MSEISNGVNLPILYEDADVVAVNKPAGLVTHSDGRTTEPSVAEWALEQYPALREVGEPWVSPQGETISRPGIVHRLDRGTSGVMILAKTNEAYAFLKKQFEDRSTEKRYRALVYGHPRKDAGVIEAEIVRIRSIPPRWGVARATEKRKHRAAITEWQASEDRPHASDTRAPEASWPPCHLRPSLRERPSLPVRLHATGAPRRISLHNDPLWRTAHV